MKKLIHSVIVSSMCVSALIGGTATVPLKQGWNAIGPNAETTLTDLKVQLGSQLLNIQSPDGLKTYASTSTRTPTFSKFDVGIGYWVKVSADTSIVVTEKDFSGDQNISLNTGWNLIDPLNILTLDEVKQQLGTKLLNIQSPDGLKTYASTSTRTPTFTQFEDGVGYWVKLNAAGTLKFTFASLVTNQAVNGTLNSSTGTYSGYTVKILTDALVAPSTASSINIYAQINSVDIGTILAINASYPSGTKFKIQVLNGANEVVGSSSEFSLTDAIKTDTFYDVGNITVTTSGGTIDIPPTVPDINTSTTITPPPSVPTI